MRSPGGAIPTETRPRNVLYSEGSFFSLAWMLVSSSHTAHYKFSRIKKKLPQRHTIDSPLVKDASIIGGSRPGANALPDSNNALGGPTIRGTHGPALGEPVGKAGGLASRGKGPRNAGRGTTAGGAGGKGSRADPEPLSGLPRGTSTSARGARHTLRLSRGHNNALGTTLVANSKLALEDTRPGTRPGGSRISGDLARPIAKVVDIVDPCTWRHADDLCAKCVDECIMDDPM